MDPKRSKQLRQKRDRLDRRLANQQAVNPDVDMAQALAAFRRDDFESCLDKCNALINADSSQLSAIMLKGRTYLAMGNCAQAIRVIASALESGIDDAILWCELGNLYSENGEHERAADAWKSSLSRDTNNFIARKNLGFALFELNELHEAEQNLTLALKLEPSDLPTMRTLATLWIKQSNFQQAIKILERAVDENPSNGATYKLLSSTYRSAGQLEKYQATLERWLKAEPDNAIAKHLMAGTREESGTAPQRASDQYIREVFDQFAATFDADLAHLHYEAPAHVMRAMGRVYGPPKSQPNLAILDAGCGTGICGPSLRHYASSLVGVDLSAQMVKLASERSCYDNLEVVELTSYLHQHQNSFDSIVGCDTFNYFGDLLELLTACHQAMRDQGILIITLEHEHESECEDYRLNMNGRYTHARSYVERTANEANLMLISAEQVPLRTEADRPVEGLLITLGK